MAEYRNESGDPYLYPGTDVLKNIPGIRDAGKLQAFETAASIARDAEMVTTPLSGSFDLNHLKAIHRHLFQDVYPWAGNIRTVDMSKGGSFFARHHMIAGYGGGVLEELAKERMEWLARPHAFNVPSRLAHYLGEINALHPFREGNGRTQRIFIGQLAESIGKKIRWERIDQGRMIEVSKLSFSGDNKPLAEMLRGITEKTPNFRRGNGIGL